LSVREQIEAFANAKAVVGLHGAGLVNCILCPPHTPVLEIYPQYYHDSSFRVLFSVANIRILYMMGEKFSTSGYPGLENASIDLKKFEMALKILVS
jgi:capsular polysaccharide biosynthesis protein